MDKLEVAEHVVSKDLNMAISYIQLIVNVDQMFQIRFKGFHNNKNEALFRFYFEIRRI